MANAVRAIGAGVECLGGIGLLALSRAVDGEVRAGALAVGFATGYCYRHARAAAGCRRFRGGPGRSLGVTGRDSPRFGEICSPRHVLRLNRVDPA